MLMSADKIHTVFPSNIHNYFIRKKISILSDIICAILVEEQLKSNWKECTVNCDVQVDLAYTLTCKV